VAVCGRGGEAVAGGDGDVGDEDAMVGWLMGSREVRGA
jgi:hypothetical protein